MYSKNMKKLICLFLMLWLPLFTGAALAMSTQMQVADALQQVQKTMPMACHELPADTQHQPAKHGCNSHCLACGVCAFGCNTASFMMTSYVFSATAISPAPNPADLVFSFPFYPPAFRPPIATSTSLSF